MFAAHVNFQPCEAPVPAGYVADCGYVYGYGPNPTRGYGWSRPRVGATRWRHEVSDLRLDTLITLHTSSSDGLPGWGISTPPGTYDVTVSVGDPNLHAVSSVAVNFVDAISEFRSTARHPFKQVTIRVTTDGDIGLATTEYRSRWDYVDIVQVS
jgi:hypothetical protein